MADPTTVNTSLAVPTRGSDIGTWDVPVNGNFTLIDSMFGSVASFALTNSPVTITSSQAQSSIIRLTGTLTGNVALTLPGIYKFWTIDNQLVNSPSSFCATLVSTSGASIIGLPPGPQDVFYDGTTVNYKNLGRIGQYWDYAGSAVPTWITNSTKPPYLNCDGTAFSSATYPILANLMGTTLPDSRGRFRITLNQTTGRVTTAVSGVDGNTLLASGGDQNAQSHTHTGTTGTESTSHTHNYTVTVQNTTTGGGGFGANSGVGTATTTGTENQTHTHSFTTATSTNATGNSQNVPPAYVGGLTLIRAA